VILILLRAEEWLGIADINSINIHARKRKSNLKGQLAILAI
jgi:hypothetical protein